jgi:hypothetical protein
VPKLALDDVFLEKEAIAKSIKEELTKSMSNFGFNILQVWGWGWGVCVVWGWGVCVEVGVCVCGCGVRCVCVYV